MIRLCPHPLCACPTNVIRDGKFQRKEDSKFIQRFRCKTCGHRFSHATFSLAYRQKKRRINSELRSLLASGMSMRRSAVVLKINRKKVDKKLKYLGELSRLALEVSLIPAFGHLSKIAIQKYGHRKDEHHDGLKRLFETITPVVSPEVVIKSDEHQRYPFFISAYFPRGKHFTFKSEKSCIAGQGELKKVAFDPLFIVNHTCAMLRYGVNRLIRKTWCTTKDPIRLKDHLDIFMFYYNEVLLMRR